MSKRDRFAKPRRGVTGHVFRPEVLTSDLTVLRNIGKKLSGFKKRSVAGGPKDFSVVVQRGLDYLAKQPGRQCCIKDCKGTPAYVLGGKFWCAKHREEVIVAKREYNRKKYYN